MILDETVEITWSNRSKQWYVNLGYTYTGTGDRFRVQVEHLPENSTVPVRAACDFCGEEFMRAYGKARGEISCKACFGVNASTTKQANAVAYNMENIEVEDETCYLKINDSTTVLFDYVALPTLMHHRWFENEAGFILTNVMEDGKTRQVPMHKMIHPAGRDVPLEHINRKKHDNRVSNLRPATPRNIEVVAPEEGRTSKYRGVSYHVRGDHWYTRIKYKNKPVRIGSFTDEVACANAYNYFATMLLGEDAQLNDAPPMTMNEWASYRTSRKPIEKVIAETTSL